MSLPAKLALLACVACLVAACRGRAPPPPDQSPQPAPEGADPVAIAEALPAEASAEELRKALDALLPAIYRLPSGEFSRATEALEILRQQSRAVDALMDRYEQLPVIEYMPRMFTVQVIGELRRADAASPLRDILWRPLPKPESTGERMAPRDFEEMIEVQAVRGLAFLRSDETDREVTQAMLKHESKSVRVAAIDAYLWNHAEDPQARERLRKVLPPDLQPFVDAVRMESGMDPQAFNEALAAWQKQWGTPPASPGRRP